MGRGRQRNALVDEASIRSRHPQNQVVNTLALNQHPLNVSTGVEFGEAMEAVVTTFGAAVNPAETFAAATTLHPIDAGAQSS